MPEAETVVGNLFDKRRADRSSDYAEARKRRMKLDDLLHNY